MQLKLQIKLIAKQRLVGKKDKKGQAVNENNFLLTACLFFIVA